MVLYLRSGPVAPCSMEGLMTRKEPELADDRMREEIAALFAETRQLDDRMRAEIARLLAKPRRIGAGTFLVPALTAAAVMGATAAVVKVFS